MKPQVLKTVPWLLLLGTGTLAGPVDKKPVDECKEVKKEIQSLQEPKTRKAATAYCSQLLDLPVYTETSDVVSGILDCISP